MPAATLSRRPASLSPHRCVPSPAGRSVIKLKDTSNLPRLTALTATLDGETINLKEHGLDYRADELLGPQYGVGLHHDSSGYGWGKAGARETLQEYIDELGLLQVIAAVPSVIATDGAPIARPAAARARPTTPPSIVRCPPHQASSTRRTSSSAPSSRRRASRPCPSPSSPRLPPP